MVLLRFEYQFSGLGVLGSNRPVYQTFDGVDYLPTHDGLLAINVDHKPQIVQSSGGLGGWQTPNYVRTLDVTPGNHIISVDIVGSARDYTVKITNADTGLAILTIASSSNTPSLQSSYLINTDTGYVKPKSVINLLPDSKGYGIIVSNITPGVSGGSIMLIDRDGNITTDEIYAEDPSLVYPGYYIIRTTDIKYNEASNTLTFPTQPAPPPPPPPQPAPQPIVQDFTQTPAPVQISNTIVPLATPPNNASTYRLIASLFNSLADQIDGVSQ